MVQYLPWAGLHNERRHLVYKHSIVALNLTLFELNCNNLIDSVLLVRLRTSADDSKKTIIKLLKKLSKYLGRKFDSVENLVVLRVCGTIKKYC